MLMPSANLFSMNSSADVRPPLEPARLSLPKPFRVEVLETAVSTNAVAAARFQEGESEGLVVVAEHQTAGRGRLDRDWITPARSSLTVSFLLTPQVEVTRWTWLPLLTGLAAASALAEVTQIAPKLKWPNDVLLNGRKAGGILLELVEHQSAPAAIVGIGINVHQAQDELPVPDATSLALEGAAVDRTQLLQALVEAFSREYDAWCGGLDPRERYRDECDTIGREVVVHMIGQDLRGTVQDVDETGQLVVLADGQVHHLAVGDVEYVRRQDQI
jgi:BirA family biotin operon repressor/biotin-[acetyl-CoA-carboxylase] ligase